MTLDDGPFIRGVRPVELEMWDFWDYLPRNGDTAMVIGAGLGAEVSTIAQLVGPSGRVYAFEAHPLTYGHLLRLCRINRWTNVEPINAAISDESGRVRISDDSDYSGNDILRGDGLEIDAISLNDFSRDKNLQHVDFITMNIEGAERLAVNGMTDFAPSVDHVSISCHDFLGIKEKATKDHVKETLLAQGFALREQSDHPHPVIRDVVYASRATRPSIMDSQRAGN